MEAVRRFREMAVLCRKTAALRSEGSSLLAEAQFWDRMADAMLLELFDQYPTRWNGPIKPNANGNDEPIAAA